FQARDDSRDRIEAETRFIRFARGRGIDTVAELLADDETARIALFSFLPGRRPDAEQIDAEAVDQAAAFYRALNRAPLPGHDSLPDASEACFSIADHVSLVGQRLHRLAKLPQADGAAAMTLARDAALPRFEAYGEALRTAAAKVGVDLERKLSREERCISP